MALNKYIKDKLGKKNCTVELTLPNLSGIELQIGYVNYFFKNNNNTLA
jgi:hypothetical protein